MSNTQLDTVKAELSPLKECAVLLDINIGGISTNRVHTLATKELSETKGNDGREAKVVFRLVAREATARVTAAAATIRAFLKAHTLPYVDTHYRVCGIEQVDFVEREIRKLTVEYDAASDELATKITGYQQDQKHRLGALAPDPKSYLTPDDIRARFQVRINRQEIPEGGGDWRFNTSDPKLESVLRRIRQEEAQKHASAEAQVSDAVFDVVRELLDEVSGKLRRYEVSEVDDGKGGTKIKKEKSWKSKLPAKVHELAARLPVLNVQNDPRVEAIIEKVAKLSDSLKDSSDEDLRQDEGQRLTVADKADEILDELAGYGS